MQRISITLALATTTAFAQLPANPTTLVREGMDAREALKIAGNIYQAVGFGNTYMVVTPAGNVIIDTSSAGPARLHVKLLKEIAIGNPESRQGNRNELIGVTEIVIR